MAQVKPFRDAYLAKHFLCEVCNKRQPVEVHEICQGPHREKALDKEYAVLAVCRKCHEALHDRAIWPLSRQIAVKVRSKPQLFGLNVSCINELRGYSDTEFEIEDIFNHLVLK